MCIRDSDCATTKPRIAVRIQQALLGHERRALAIDVNGATFINDGRTVMREALDLEHLARHQMCIRDSLFPARAGVTARATA